MKREEGGESWGGAREKKTHKKVIRSICRTRPQPPEPKLSSVQKKPCKREGGGEADSAAAASCKAIAGETRKTFEIANFFYDLRSFLLCIRKTLCLGAIYRHGGKCVFVESLSVRPFRGVGSRGMVICTASHWIMSLLPLFPLPLFHQIPPLLLFFLYSVIFPSEGIS